jgi:hypothetical protein
MYALMCLAKMLSDANEGLPLTVKTVDLPTAYLGWSFGEAQPW